VAPGWTARHRRNETPQYRSAPPNLASQPAQNVSHGRISCPLQDRLETAQEATDKSCGGIPDGWRKNVFTARNGLAVAAGHDKAFPRIAIANLGLHDPETTGFGRPRSVGKVRAAMIQSVRSVASLLLSTFFPAGRDGASRLPDSKSGRWPKAGSTFTPFR